MLSQMLFSYILLYILIPVFFRKKKYIQFACTLLLAWLVTAIFRYSVYIYVYNPIMVHLHYYTNTPSQLYLWSIFQTINGPAFMSGTFISFKLFKDSQQKQKDNFDLQKENASAELQLLKAQVHPHFLFNTLNNIYSFTLNKSGNAGEMVLQLSDMMKYMINDCATEFVPLRKELKMMGDYIGLEKVRYGNRLDIQTEIEGDCENKMISPLFMIPFVENSFKHGASKLLKDPWIKLFIQVDENVLHFTLSNNKKSEKETVSKKEGIGLANAKKRLELLYPQTHLLLIEQTTNTFTVNMQIPVLKNTETNILHTTHAEQ